MLLQENGESLTDFKSIPRPNAADMPTFTNKLIVDELNYNKDELYLHEKIMESVGSDDDGFFFLYGYSVDRSMRDIMSKNDPLNKFKPFGGMTIVLGGDIRQILPVVRKGTRQDIVDASINSSQIYGNNASDENGEMKVEIPEDLLISDTTNLLMSLIDFVYLDLNDNLGDPLFFQERGILAPTLDSVEHVNEYMMSLIPGEEKEYLNSDSVCRSGENSDVQSEWFTTEFLNGIKSSGIPNHRLKLKVGCPVMLMRNIDQANGLCNGTRLTVTHLGKTTIAATVITGKRAGTKVFIPRMNLIPSDPGLPFKFMRR
ncbi:PIF1-like helicase [Medicago truncatula]|uniref:ATP-dependent DNA helicase n=1 Tax=Medicago truncatula TaxID=3880 RepID=A0A072V8T0_MEDTR|nr:PIF1-like helicase [Medicago truncatula]